MQKFPCPSCGAEIIFQSSISVYAVCKNCASMIVRHDKDVESIGAMAQLPDDISPLQLGTEGKYHGMKFTLIGRVKMGWEDGNWNEWFMYMDDGSRGWLAEAQGFLAISFEFDDAQHVDAGKTLDKLTENIRNRPLMSTIDKSYDKTPGAASLGEHIFLHGKRLQIVDIKEAACIGSEGELPFRAPKGRTAIYVDMLGDKQEFGGIEYYEGTPRIYLGEYVEFDALRLSNLRELEGWQKAAMAGNNPFTVADGRK